MNIDKNFKFLIEFIKERNLDEIINVIKQNFNYQKNKNNSEYMSIINYYNTYKLWGEIDLDNNLELIENNARSLVEHYEDFDWLYNKLDDYKSKVILLNIMYYWLMLDPEKINILIDKYFLQYFDLDLLKFDENEIIVDVGAYTGDTLINYINIFGKENYKKIYCYEIVPKNINYLNENIKNFDLDNIEIKEKAAMNYNGKTFIDNEESSSVTQVTEDGVLEVDAVKIDDDIKGKITFVKMDIEGAELLALEGMKNKIKKYKPKLAISVYHNNDHLWKIPKLLHELNPRYKFYLRYYGGKLVPTEYILYAK